MPGINNVKVDNTNCIDVKVQADKDEFCFMFSGHLRFNFMQICAIINNTDI